MKQITQFFRWGESPTLNFMADFVYLPFKYIPLRFVIRLKITYIWLDLNNFSLFNAELMASFCKLKPCSLWIVQAKDNVNGNCTLLIVTEFALSLLILNRTLLFSTGTHRLVRDILYFAICFNSLFLSLNST